MPLYFAYGANMDVAAMARRCPGAVALGPARLPRHRFFITRDGYASVQRHPRAVVHGVLWDLPLAAVRVLDRFEDVDGGLYAKLHQPVIADGGPKRALVYVATSLFAGRPRPGYLESVMASAETWNLPVAYRQEIAGFIGGQSAIATGRPAVTPRAVSPLTTVGQAARAGDVWKWRP